jgi:predicted nucleic acid-binding Zn finger protein
MITLKDKLSQLSYTQACKVLGPQGKQLILEGGKFDIDLFEQVTLSNERFSLSLENAEVIITLDDGNMQGLNVQCDVCSGFCVHQGAALSLILEEKLALGLSAPPPERVPMESLSEEALVSQAIADRREKAQTEKMRLKSFNPRELWTDYVITNKASGKSYRIALRGWKQGESYCSCPDFRKNTLGTCKHIIHALDKASKKFDKAVRETPAETKDICVYLRYGRRLRLGILLP